MPAGQWVAFEGYDQVHDCDKPVARNLNATIYTGTVPSHVARGSSGPDSALQHSPASIDSLSRAQIRDTFRAAVDRHIVAEISYLDASSRPTARSIEPLEISGDLCYAYCRLRNDFRHFRVSRTQIAKLTDEEFLPRPAPTSRSYSEKTTAPAVWLFWVVVLVAIAYWIFH